MVMDRARVYACAGDKLGHTGLPSAVNVLQDPPACSLLHSVGASPPEGTAFDLCAPYPAPPGSPDAPLRDEVPQPVGSVAPEHIEGFRLDLADPLARHAQFPTDLFEGAGVL